MRRLRNKITPARGFSHFFHIGFNILLPVLAYVLVRIDFVSVAIALILLSKWRIFAVRPRYWVAHLISNGVDILVGVSLVLFMANTALQWWQIIWAIAYILWLVVLKPRSDVLSVSAQAMIGQLVALSALYLKFGDVPLAVLVASTAGISYICARHFLSSFSEPNTGLLSLVWAYFAGGLTFVLGHWLLFYGFVSQIVLILTVVGYAAGALYYLNDSEKLSPKAKRQLIYSATAVLAVIIVLSDWSGTAV